MMSKMCASPSLSEMEFDSPKIDPFNPETIVLGQAAPGPVRQEPAPGKLTRYLTPDRSEAFIAPLAATLKDTIALLQKECPSLRHLPPDEIHFKLRFDGNTSASVKDVLFRVLPQAWPKAVTEILPLIIVETRRSAASPASTGCLRANGVEMCEVDQASKKTWEDLQREGALLGVHGETHCVIPPVFTAKPGQI